MRHHIEYIGENVLAYVPIPGQQKGCVDLIEATGGMFSSDILASTGAEDFAFFSNEVPGLYFWLGVNGKNVESAPGNHTPYFIVHDSALDAGVKSFINLVSDYSDDHSGN